MTSRDLVFLGSLSGETEQVIRMALIAQSKQAKIVTFTTYLQAGPRLAITILLWKAERYYDIRCGYKIAL